jgi:hypothetical protein
MPRLPAYTQAEDLNTGSQFMRPVDAPLDVARGLNSLGSDFANISRRIQVDAQRNKENTERVQAAQAVMNFATFEQAETDRLREAAENVNVSGADFQRSFMEGHQQRAEAFYLSLNDDMKTRLGPQIMSTVSRFDDNSYKIEQQKVATFAADSLKTATTAATEGVLAGRDPAQARVNLYASIGALNLPPNRAAEAKKIADQSVDAAVTRKFIADNPSEAERQIRDQAVGTPTGMSESYKTSYDAALRNGHDPRLMLMVEMAESGGNPTARNPMSTAYGKFQFLDGDWAETGIPKSSDPSMQAEAMARRLTFLKGTLQRNGLELTPTSVYGAHFLGRGGFVAVASADPNGNFLETYARVAGSKTAAKALAGNRALLGDGTWTNAQVLARIGNYAEGRYGEAIKMVEGPTDFKPDEPATINGQPLVATTRADIAGFLADA